MVETFMARHHEDMHPVTREIIAGGAKTSAASAFRARYELAELKRDVSRLFETMDVLILPTAPTIFTIEEVERDPVATNSRLGIFANFVNLPGSLRIGHSGRRVAERVALRCHADRARRPGPRVAGLLCPAARRTHRDRRASGRDPHRGLRRAPSGTAAQRRVNPARRLPRPVAPAPALATGSMPCRAGKRPGLIRDQTGGAAIAVEVWSLPTTAVGTFLAGIDPPLGLGRIELSDDTWVGGFIAETRPPRSVRPKLRTSAAGEHIERHCQRARGLRRRTARKCRSRPRDPGRVGWAKTEGLGGGETRRARRVRRVSWR